MARVLRQPASTLSGIGMLSDGDRVIGEARFRLQFFHVHRIERGPAGNLIQRREREVYGDGELLSSGTVETEITLTLHLRDGRSFQFTALPHCGGRTFDVVPVAPVAGSLAPPGGGFKPSRP